MGMDASPGRPAAARLTSHTPSTRFASYPFTRTETPLRDIPQFINEIPQQLIRSQGATTIQEALRNAPGISYAASEGGTQANRLLYMRGFPVNVMPVRDYGVKFYGTVIYTNEALLKSNPDLVKRFVRATMKSLIWTRDNMEKAVLGKRTTSSWPSKRPTDQHTRRSTC